MKTIDAMGKPCPIPVIEAKKALAGNGGESVLIKVDNIVAVQNLEKMSKGYGYGFSYTGQPQSGYDVMIRAGGESVSERQSEVFEEPLNDIQSGSPSNSEEKVVVVISRNSMGDGAEELGKILIKGFIYSLTELATPPKAVIFLNSGAHLTSEGSTVIEDLKRLEAKGTEVLTCGTCINYYGLQDRLAIGVVCDMYGITERMAGASKVINI